MCASGKVQYASAAAAWKAIRKSGKRPSLLSKQTCYRCPYCDQWHTTKATQNNRHLKAYKRHRMELEWEEAA